MKKIQSLMNYNITIKTLNIHISRILPNKIVEFHQMKWSNFTK